MRVRAGSPSNAPTAASMSVSPIVYTLGRRRPAGKGRRFEPGRSVPRGPGSVLTPYSRPSTRAARTPPTRARGIGAMEDGMITLCIRYTLNASKRADFEAYARSLATPIERCGGKLIGYFSPTKLAGPTNIALAL